LSESDDVQMKPEQYFQSTDLPSKSTTLVSVKFNRAASRLAASFPEFPRDGSVGYGSASWSMGWQLKIEARRPSSLIRVKCLTGRSHAGAIAHPSNQAAGDKPAPPFEN